MRTYVLGLGLNIKKISVLINFQFADVVQVYTDMPSPFPNYKGCLSFSFQTDQGTGVEYVRDNFGVDPEVINAARPL